MIFFQNIYTLLTNKNILKLEYENYYNDDEDIICYCGVCDFMICYISQIINFFIYKLKNKNY
jgi:hypothetical protein